MVNKPHAKNSKNITTRAWYTLASPIPELCKTKIIKYINILYMQNMCILLMYVYTVHKQP